MTMYFIRPDNKVKEKVLQEIQELPDKTWCIQITEGNKKRTTQQNAYMHKLIQIICDYTGDDITHMKRTIAWKCDLREVFVAPEKVIELPKRTSEMNKEDCGKMITAAQIICLELGLSYPDPAEYGYELR